MPGFELTTPFQPQFPPGKSGLPVNISLPPPYRWILRSGGKVNNLRYDDSQRICSRAAAVGIKDIHHIAFSSRHGRRAENAGYESVMLCLQIPPDGTGDNLMGASIYRLLNQVRHWGDIVIQRNEILEGGVSTIALIFNSMGYVPGVL